MTDNRTAPYENEIKRLRNYSARLETILWNIFDSRAWKLISLFRKAIVKREKPENKQYGRPQTHGVSRERVSVVIPCYNQGSYVEDAIESVRSQTYGNIELVVVDDGSTDPYTRLVLSSLKDIKVIVQKNAGLSAARNTGIKSAQGALICCLDADDRLAPDYIKKCVSRIRKNKLDICGTYLKTFGDVWANIRMPWLKPTLNNIMEKNSFIAASVFTRSVWERVGGYDEAMKDGYEDWDFWIRALSKGAKGENVPEYLFYYRRAGKSMIDGSQSKHANIIRYIRSKHC
jgi:glycosyltransferase involved in cell wall biosynthesis